MRELETQIISREVARLSIEANYYLADDVKNRITQLKEREESPTAEKTLAVLLKNYEAAAEQKMPICQDTGVAVIFADIGQDLHIVGGDFTEAVNEGVRRGYKEGYLRKSMVDDPVIDRKNTGDNTPAVIHTRIVPGDKLHLTVVPKGGGAENMSEVRMMKSADGIEGVMDFVTERVERSGGNPCPPVIVGVGIGGDFEQSAVLAKRSLLRPLDQVHPGQKWARVEEELLERINNLGIGPQGFGGRITALAVKIETMACHIASMPVAVNIQCHASRHKSASL
ncbi:MAG: fumarate hydratase [Spirochaetales bacterium]|nr:fumarate hydratase [Spirochaetales bacterium]MCF7938898.1 fumarate hydratase [Spirochaetales bacterium]